MDLLAKIQPFLTWIGIGSVAVLAIRIVTQLVVLAREVLNTYKTTLEVRKLLDEEEKRVRTTVTANEAELKKYRRRPEGIDFDLGLKPSSEGALSKDPKASEHVQKLEEENRAAISRFYEQKDRGLARIVDPTAPRVMIKIFRRTDLILSGVSLVSLSIVLVRWFVAR